MDSSMLTLEQRIRRLEALEALRDLVARHALAEDERDLDALVDLYASGAVTPEGAVGRDAVRDWFDRVLRQVGVTVHLVGAQLFELHGEDRATGRVQCRAEHEDGELWIVATLEHHDEYRVEDGAWRLERRVTHCYYAGDLREHPLRVPDRFHFPGAPAGLRADLPETRESWQRFWGDTSPIGTPATSS
jgi:hypothetical protein